MNADPFRPLPTRRDYEADMAQIDDHEDEEVRDWNPIALVVLVYAGAICFALGWVVTAAVFP